eukprot:scaffold13386_cov154-Skeletonema_marinoi.AAC.8
MLVAKMLFNSVISTKGARFMTMDISNFYLMTPLTRPEYIRISLKDIPEEIIIEYKLREIADDKGQVYIQANKGMYGLPQSGRLANELLEKRLNKRGYHQSKLVPGLYKHEWRPIMFTLVVDDFGVSYNGEEHAIHLKETLEENYTVTTDWTGGRYIGITIDWDYKRRQVHLSIPGTEHGSSSSIDQSNRSEHLRGCDDLTAVGMKTYRQRPDQMANTSTIEPE